MCRRTIFLLACLPALKNFLTSGKEILKMRIIAIARLLRAVMDCVERARAQLFRAISLQE